MIISPKNFLKNTLTNLLNLLFPFKCVICETMDTNDHICHNCWNKIEFISQDKHYHYALSTNSYQFIGQVQAIMNYNHYSKKLIKKFKYYDQLHLLPYLSNLMINQAGDLIKQADLIVPVAMHPFKLLRRGYNQASILAHEIAKFYHKMSVNDLLIKTKNTTPQAFLSKAKRQKNIINSFKVNPKYHHLINDKVILLVDDVITTGATIKECSKILNKLSPKKILVLALARRI